MNTLNTFSSHIPTLVSDNTLMSEDAEKAEVLNIFSGESFNKSDPPLQHSSSQYLSDSTSDISLIDISQEKVVCLISSLKPKVSPEIDAITVEMLPLVVQCIGPALTLLFNHFLAMGKIQSEWKVGKVIPIPKGKHLQLPSNYRPIMLLPIVSKIFKRHIFNILRDFIQNQCPLSPNQWGFCSGKSTSAALAYITHCWNTKLHTGVDICAVVFDLRKAFDSVSHRALIQKLSKLDLPPLLFQ